MGKKYSSPTKWQKIYLLNKDPNNIPENKPNLEFVHCAWFTDFLKFKGCHFIQKEAKENAQKWLALLFQEDDQVSWLRTFLLDQSKKWFEYIVNQCSNEIKILQIALENFFAREKLGAENRFEDFHKFTNSKDKYRKKISQGLTVQQSFLSELVLADTLRHSLDENNSYITLVIRQIVDIHTHLYTEKNKILPQIDFGNEDPVLLILEVLGDVKALYEKLKGTDKMEYSLNLDIPSRLLLKTGEKCLQQCPKCQAFIPYMFIPKHQIQIQQSAENAICKQHSEKYKVNIEQVKNIILNEWLSESPDCQCNEIYQIIVKIQKETNQETVVHWYCESCSQKSTSNKEKNKKQLKLNSSKANALNMLLNCSCPEQNREFCFKLKPAEQMDPNEPLSVNLDWKCQECNVLNEGRNVKCIKQGCGSFRASYPKNLPFRKFIQQHQEPLVMQYEELLYAIPSIPLEKPIETFLTALLEDKNIPLSTKELVNSFQAKFKELEDNKVSEKISQDPNFEELDERTNIHKIIQIDLEDKVRENLNQRTDHRKYLELVRNLLADIEFQISGIGSNLETSKQEHDSVRSNISIGSVNNQLKTMKQDKTKGQTKKEQGGKLMQAIINEPGATNQLRSLGKFSAVDLQARNVIFKIDYHAKVVKRANFLFKENENGGFDVKLFYRESQAYLCIPRDTIEVTLSTFTISIEKISEMRRTAGSKAKTMFEDEKLVFNVPQLVNLLAEIQSKSLNLVKKLK